MIDLDRFKQVNDSLGHHVGDTLLQLAGARISEALRSGDLLARIGGDEFGVVLQPADENNAGAAAKRLRDVLLTPFVINGVTLHLDASIGVAVYPTHGNDAQELFRHADAAMYQAKTKEPAGKPNNPLRDDHTTDDLATTEALRTGGRQRRRIGISRQGRHGPSGVIRAGQLHSSDCSADNERAQTCRLGLREPRAPLVTCSPIIDPSR